MIGKPFAVVVCFCISIFLNGKVLFAQALKKDSIRTIQIIDKRKSGAQPATQTLDSNLLLVYNANSLNQMLQWHSNVFVKNYGVGNVSTISIRGSSAAQTQVNWHGVNINNAMTGLSDFSAMPVAFFNKIEIAYGNTQPTNSVSGSINLENEKPSFLKQKKMNSMLAYESLQNIVANTSFLFANKKFSNTLKLNFNHDQNRYSFYNEDQNAKDTLQHAQTKSLHLSNDLYYKVNVNNILSFHLWTFQRERQIPAASFETNSVKHEENTVLRTLITWEKTNFYRWNLLSTIGVITENYTYTDSAIQLVNNASVLQIPLSIKANYSPKPNHYLSIEATASKADMLSQSEANMYTGGLQASYRIDNVFKSLSIKAGLKKELNSIFTLPYAYHLFTQYKLFRGLDLYASWSTNYRMPTLNDLYFIPGGNKNLKPEHSKNFESGIRYTKQNGKLHFHHDLAYFNRSVKNWILWYGSSIFTPHNIQEVHSRGVEYMMDFAYHLFSTKSKNENSKEPLLMEIQQKQPFSKVSRHAAIIGGILYAYTLSTTVNSVIPNDYSINKQIPYVPRYQLKMHIGLKTNLGEFTYFHTYTGYRFITTDETQYLTPYQTGNLMLTHKFQFKTYRCMISGKCLNLFNTNYQSITGRYMPQRNWSVAMNFEF